MGVRIKICGITTPEAAIAASELGADAVGFVFAESPRRVTIDTASELASRLSPFITRVAVFRHPELSSVSEVASELAPDVIQTEPTADIVAALRGHPRLLPVFHDGPDLSERITDYATNLGPGDAVLLEAAGRGGRGTAPSWERASAVARSTRLVLAGGLSPTNVQDAILTVRPYAVDVSSGVESRPGIKDPELIAEFIAATREAENKMEAFFEPAR